MAASSTGFEICPERITVVGGGRWARVITEVLCQNTPPSVRIVVQTTHNLTAVRDWAAQRGLSARVQVAADLLLANSGGKHAVIVANAARDHEQAVERALSAGTCVLVEKPMALTAAACRRLVASAHKRNAIFAAAHVCLFARYLENLSRHVAQAGGARSVTVRWTDRSGEVRYGEKKSFDEGLPVFVDCLPHVSSCLGALVGESTQHCEHLQFLRGGAHLQLDLICNEVRCTVLLARNAEKRQRLIEVNTDCGVLALDFTSEPGTLTTPEGVSNADPCWQVQTRPLTSLLQAFLRVAAGGDFDRRLDVAVSLRAAPLIDETAALYNPARLSWLAAQLETGGGVSTDARYAFREIVQSRGPCEAAAVEKQIAEAQRRYSGKAGVHQLAAWVESYAPRLAPT